MTPINESSLDSEGKCVRAAAAINGEYTATRTCIKSDNVVADWYQRDERDETRLRNYTGVRRRRCRFPCRKQSTNHARATVFQHHSRPVRQQDAITREVV